MRAVPTVLMINPRLNMACRRPAQMAFFMFSSLLSAILGNREAGIIIFTSNIDSEMIIGSQYPKVRSTMVPSNAFAVTKGCTSKDSVNI